MNVKVDNGKRVTVHHASAAGPGGIVELNGITSVAYPARFNRHPPKSGETLQVGETRWTVLDVRKSKEQTGMLVVDVRTAPND